jgi:adenylate cyclase
MFDSTSALGEKEDIIFAESLKKNKNVVLASEQYIQKTKTFSKISWNIPIKILREQADYGFVLKEMDPDSYVRNGILYRKDTNIGEYYSWDLHILAKFLNTQLSAKTVQVSSKEIKFFNKVIPLNPDKGTVIINFIGPKGSFKTIPFYQVLDERIDMSFFQNKIVLIGSTAPILHDFFYTPFGQMPGVEIHANSIQTILQNNYIYKLPILLQFFLLLLIVLGIIWFSLKARPIKGFYFTLSILLAYSIIGIIIFIKFNYFLNWTIPLVLGFSAYFVVILIRFIKEEKSKRLIKSIFSQYVSPTVVEELIKDPSKLKLGGEKRELTVFFSDVRAFTTFSENHTPEQVVEALNEYLDAMTAVIFKWHGTLDKYVGDEIMAIWGAPLPQPNHAELAVRCCWEQLSELRKLQSKWKAEGRAILDIGMGLNTGEMITGNIGSAMHKDYTVIGDAVNLGARLESETRHYGTAEKPCYLIISEFTYKYIKDIVTVKSLGQVKVKGKNQPVSIYEVLDVRPV